MKPQNGEFWIVEVAGEFTVGQCFNPGSTIDLWEVCGRNHLVDSRRADFRAVRKIDVDALLDQPAPVAPQDVEALPGEDSDAALDQLRSALTPAEALALARDAVAFADQLEAESLQDRATSREQIERRKPSPELAELQRRLADPMPIDGPTLTGRVVNAETDRLRAKLAEAEATIVQIALAKLFVEQLKTTRRMLWLVVKSAGAPGGVTIDKEAIDSFDPLSAELHSSTDLATGNVHIEARVGKDRRR